MAAARFCLAAWSMPVLSTCRQFDNIRHSLCIPRSAWSRAACHPFNRVSDTQSADEGDPVSDTKNSPRAGAKSPVDRPADTGLAAPVARPRRLARTGPVDVGGASSPRTHQRTKRQKKGAPVARWEYTYLSWAGIATSTTATGNGRLGQTTHRSASSLAPTAFTSMR